MICSKYFCLLIMVIYIIVFVLVFQFCASCCIHQASSVSERNMINIELEPTHSKMTKVQWGLILSLTFVPEEIYSLLFVFYWLLFYDAHKNVLIIKGKVLRI